MSTFRAFGKTYDALGVGATIAIGFVGALGAVAIGLPLPWLSGALLAVATAAIAGWAPAARPIQFPMDIRLFFVPIVGVSIGGAFTPALLDEAPRWWPTLLALLLFVPLAHWLSYQLFRRLGRIDAVTAYYAAMPGGLIEAVAMGEEAGADVRMLTLLQFARLIFCILTVPIVFTLVEGFAVGSAAGVEMVGADNPIGPIDAVVLTLSAVIGFFGARALHLPAALITGPILVSGLAHLTGLTEATPPAWMVLVTQLVVGTSLGARFAGFDRRVLPRAAGVAFLGVAVLLCLAGLAGWALAPFVGERVEAVVLAFAPGGVVEMSLIAVSLQISVVYVAAHHVLRILAAVLFGQIGARFGLGRAGPRGAR